MSAKLVTGGEREGAAITPAILTATAPGMKLHDEEIFGPVLAIEPYDDFEDALGIARSTACRPGCSRATPGASRR